MRIRERATKNGARHHGAHSTFGGRDSVDWVEATGRRRPAAMYLLRLDTKSPQQNDPRCRPWSTQFNPFLYNSITYSRTTPATS